MASKLTQAEKQRRVSPATLQFLTDLRYVRGLLRRAIREYDALLAPKRKKRGKGEK